MAVTGLKSWGTQLVEIQAKIDDVQTNQRYEIGGRSIQRALLFDLHTREKFLINKLETEGDIVAGSSVSRGSAQVQFNA